MSLAHISLSIDLGNKHICAYCPITYANAYRSIVNAQILRKQASIIGAISPFSGLSRQHTPKLSTISLANSCFADVTSGRGFSYPGKSSPQRCATQCAYVLQALIFGRLISSFVLINRQNHSQQRIMMRNRYSNDIPERAGQAKRKTLLSSMRIMFRQGEQYFISAEQKHTQNISLTNIMREIVILTFLRKLEQQSRHLNNTS